MMTHLRLLTPADTPALRRFLDAHAAETMLLRSNLARSGIVDGDKPYQGRYAAAFDGDAITAVVGNFWNGMLLIYAPQHVAALTALVTEDRQPIGILGPWQQSLDAQEALQRSTARHKLRSKEVLMSLQLKDLQRPVPLPNQQLSWRIATPADADLLTEWRNAMTQETLGDTPSQASAQENRSNVERWIAEGDQFLLLDGGRPVSGCSFNARLPDSVQLGNVWTPPEWRSRRYARTVVAGALEHAQKNGASKAILFTDQQNTAAQTAYAALGFTAIGDYAILLFAD